MNLTSEMIDAIRNMNVPKLNEESEYSDGYSDALDDVVEMLETLETDKTPSPLGDFV